ncbi:MAG: hypothetical protein ABR511_14680 [Acidimicrobiales bacterium]
MRPSDERRHQPGPQAGWEESWFLEFVAADGALGGFVRLALRPARRRAWYWAYLVGARRPVVVVRDHEVEVPRGPDLEVRAAGLWAQVICETPFEHWSTGLEAFAVAMDGADTGTADDRAAPAGEERGDPVPLGLDLEWEMTGRPAGPPEADGVGGYLQPAAVSGDVLVGSERLALEGTGWYGHHWGPPPWARAGGWASAAAHLPDGAVSASWSGSGPPGNGSWSGSGWPGSGSPGKGSPESRSSANGSSGRGWWWAPGTAGQSAVGVATSIEGPDHSGVTRLVVDGTVHALVPTARVAVPVDGGPPLVRSLCPLPGGGGWVEWRRADDAHGAPSEASRGPGG